MSGASGDSPPAAVGRAVWERLIDGDPTAPWDLAVAQLDPLAEWLIGRNPRVDRADCETAAEDAILALSKNPAAYQPERQTLEGYLRMSASGDLKNILHAEKRHRVRRANLDAVEHSPTMGKYLRDDDADPAGIIERDEDTAAMIAAGSKARSAILQGLPPEDATVLDLMLDGERKTNVYAHVLGLDDRPLDEQIREVKRVKDRLKKRIARWSRP